MEYPRFPSIAVGGVYILRRGAMHAIGNGYENSKIGELYLHIDLHTGFARGASEGRAGSRRGRIEGRQPSLRFTEHFGRTVTMPVSLQVGVKLPTTRQSSR